jgi:hypothetical protein
MLAARQGFGRWGFVLGNVLLAFGAPVFVTSLVSVVAGGRTGSPARREDLVAVAAGAVFMCAGLVFTVLAGRARHERPGTRAARYDFLAINEYRAPTRAGDSNGGRSRGNTDGNGVIGRLDLNLGTPDTYHARPGSGLALADAELYDEPDAELYAEPYWYDEPAGWPPARGRAGVPPQRYSATGHRSPARNTRGWGGADRFCEPSPTGTRSSGTRRRPPAG